MVRGTLNKNKKITGIFPIVIFLVVFPTIGINQVNIFSNVFATNNHSTAKDYTICSEHYREYKAKAN